MNGLLTDFRWAQSEGEPLELSFSFAAPGSEFDLEEYDLEPPNPVTDSAFRAYTDEEKAIVRAVMAELETVANIRVTEVEDSPSTVIRFGISNTGSGSVAYAYTPDALNALTEDEFPGEHESYVLSGDIWVSHEYTPGPATEAFFRSTIIHELGHALGLSHPHDTFYYLERSEPVTDKLILRNQDYDQYRYTVMSYNPVAIVDENKLTSGERENTTYSQLDIDALQFLYGESQDTADDLYLVGNISIDDPTLSAYQYDRVHGHDNLYVGIADGGGYNTLVIDVGVQAVSLSLVPGTWSNSGGGATTTDNPEPYDNLWLADSAVIHQLVLGAGDDIVYDSEGGQQISLGDGADTLVYVGGDDAVDGGAGHDIARLDAQPTRFQFSVNGDQLSVKELTSGDLLVLTGIEELAFADDTVLSSAAAASGLSELNAALLVDEGVAAWQSPIVAAAGGEIGAEEARLYRIYYGAMNRAPDEGGYDWWLERVQNDTFQFDEVADRFIDSFEFRQLADEDQDGTIEDAEFLDHVYNTVFGRAPDDDGYNWWLQQLDDGVYTQGSAFASMTQSDEFVLLSAGAVSDFWLWAG